MSISDSQSGNISISNNDQNPNPNNMLMAYTKDLKKCFVTLKSQNEVAKITKRKTKNNLRKKNSKDDSKSSHNTKKNSHSKSQSKSLLATPLEFYVEFQDFIRKEKEKKIEQEKEQEIIRMKEEKKNNEKNEKEKKRQEKIDLRKQKYEGFWNKVKSYIEKKNEHLSEIAYKIKLRNEENEKNSISELKYSKSSMLFYPKNRTALYKYKNIKENSLNKELHKFYNLCQKERRNEGYNHKTIKTQRHLNFIYDEDEKNFDSENRYKQFYEKKLSWLKKREDKINIRRKYLNSKFNNYVESFPYKPHIDKKSKKIVQNRNSFMNFLENKLNSENTVEKITINKNDIYQKYLVTIKPYMSFYFERKSPYYKRNKKSYLTPNKSNKSINIGMIHVNKGNNIRLIDENSKNKDDNNQNKTSNKKSIYNIFKPDKKYSNSKKNKNQDNKEKEENDKNVNNKKQSKKTLWWNEIDKINNIKGKNKKTNNKYNGLYKVNVRENCSWNKVCINNIIPRSFNKDLLYDFL